MENQSNQSQNDIVQEKKKDNKDSLEIYLLATEEAVKAKRNETYRKQSETADINPMILLNTLNEYGLNMPIKTQRL